MPLPDESHIIAAQKSECAIDACDRWTIGQLLCLVRTFDLAPLQGAPLWGGRFPGLKSWAESSSPFGAQIPDVTFGKMSKLQRHEVPAYKVERPRPGGTAEVVCQSHRYLSSKLMALQCILNKETDV